MNRPGTHLPVGDGTFSPLTLAPLIQAIHAHDPVALAKLRHALRTPLNQIIGYSEMLIESAAELNRPALHADLKHIHTAGGQLVSLIQEALAPWKMETGQINFAQLRHEMRTPLNTVMGYAELCLDEAQTAPFSELTTDCQKILRAARNLHSLFESEYYPQQMTASLPPRVRDSLELNHRPPALSLAAPLHEAPYGVTNVPLTTARILVVDDDELNRDMLVRRLEKNGYQLEEAANGKLALTKLKDGNYDLVLLDILMPDLDGFQTLEFIKADPRLRHIPVIMLTALDDVDSTVRCIEAGAEDFVPKPFNPAILRARLTASLEKKRLRDQEQAYLTELKNERAKSERLLLNVLPKAIAERLKAGQRTIVDSFIDSTVLFADIVEFTKISAKQSPQRTVQLLNEIFSNFDQIAEELKLEKIKTIGDAYMLVSGVPLIRADHAEACAQAAFAMLEAVRQFNQRHQLDWSIRIGMNSGPVVAGIIGTKKFSYDLWGDTVNIASRMESHGQPGQIQISSVTRKLLSAQFVCDPVGVIEIKNSAPIATYLLRRSATKA
jgi:adenylate cyclase